jgi:hypothetical protein
MVIAVTLPLCAYIWVFINPETSILIGASLLSMGFLVIVLGFLVERKHEREHEKKV